MRRLFPDLDAMPEMPAVDFVYRTGGALEEALKGTYEGTTVTVDGPFADNDAVKFEQSMVAFLSGEVDVLVATTVIENGLDIPRANTLIVNPRTATVSRSSTSSADAWGAPTGRPTPTSSCRRSGH